MDTRIPKIDRVVEMTDRQRAESREQRAESRQQTELHNKVFAGLFPLRKETINLCFLFSFSWFSKTNFHFLYWYKLLY